MGFASEWLEAGSLFPAMIREAPDVNTGIIIVVPVFDEPELGNLLGSLANCSKPDCNAEVIIVVNAPSDASSQSLNNNYKTIKEAESRKRDNRNPLFRLYYLNLGQPSIKGWGVGLARKAGMDEALRRFNTIDKPEGVIVNLDADCQVEENYFQAIEKELLKAPEKKGCSIYFEHPVEGVKYPSEIYRAVAQYELHLRYYYHALGYTGFPYVFHTVGSAVAVKALAYAKAGGMNRRQAGEDFYFIQKLVPSGGYFNLNSTTVYPSPRISSRVPFGTGPAVGKLVQREENQFMTYNPSAFRDLRTFFLKVEEAYKLSEKESIGLFSEFPFSMQAFIDKTDWECKICEIKSNTSGFLSFKKRFFAWFNMFRVVKYLNHVHNNLYEKIPAEKAASQLLEMTGIENIPQSATGLLNYFREKEKGL